MDNFAKFNQSITIRSSKNTLPLIQDKTIKEDFADRVKRQDFQNRMHELEGSIRLMEKKYKQNLKEGFENKIKSYRLQAVMQRKVIKATILETKKQIEQQELKQKMKRAQNEREKEAERNDSIQHRRQFHKKRVRIKASLQKDHIRQQLRIQEQKANYQSKEAHDKIVYDQKNIDRKKIYFDSLRKIQLSREVEEQKKLCISRIIENKQILSKLKNELQILTNQVKSKQNSNKSTLSPFLTI